MHAVSYFVRSGEARIPAVFVAAPIPRGRPRVRFLVRISTEEDADSANNASIPLFALTSDTITALGYPVRFPSQLVVARSILRAVETRFRTISFVSEEAALRPRIEDVTLAFSNVDPIAARVVLERNRADVDPEYLLKRVLSENLEARATYARFFDLAPALPRVGPSISVKSLEREFRKNPPTGRIP
jgi:hypothetical protein